MAAQGITMKQVNKYVAPDQFRQEQVLPFGTVIAYTDNKSGWLAVPQGVQNMPPEILKQAQGELFRQLPALLLATGRTVNAVEENTVEIAAGSERVRVVIDPATGLPARMLYRGTGETGAPTEVSESFSDWRVVDGLRVPFKIVQEEGGKKVAEATATEYKFNSGLTAQELGKRP